MSLLSDADRKLPQVGQVLPFLLRGIGIHHSGLLPIVKEVIEIMFGEGLIKVCFLAFTFHLERLSFTMAAKILLSVLRFSFCCP